MEPVNLQLDHVTKLSADRRTDGNKTAEAQEKFADILKQSLNNVNDMQVKSDKMTQLMATGQVEDLHEVMVVAQKANITLQTTVEVRNKVIEAYQEIMRMQI